MLGCCELADPQLDGPSDLAVLHRLADKAAEGIADRAEVRGRVPQVRPEIAGEIEPERRAEVAVRGALPLILDPPM